MSDPISAWDIMSCCNKIKFHNLAVNQYIYIYIYIYIIALLKKLMLKYSTCMALCYAKMCMVLSRDSLLYLQTSQFGSSKLKKHWFTNTENKYFSEQTGFRNIDIK